MTKERPTHLIQFAQLVESGRRLTFDYALGAAIAALLPFPSLLWLRALVVLFLHYKLARGLGKLWAFYQHRRVAGWFKTWLCMVRALFWALLVWFGMVVLGMFLPWFGVLALGAGTFAYFWSFGIQLQHFYMHRVVRHSRVSTNANASVEGPNDEA